MIGKLHPSNLALSLCLIVAATLHSTFLAAEPVKMPATAAEGYLILMENFAGWCEEHWNEEVGAFDAEGSGVTWPRGNGGVCIVYAVLLTEFPDRAEFTPKKIKREVMLDHVRRAIRTTALANRTCTHPDRTETNAWGGKGPDGKDHWQSALETEHWVLASHMLRDQLDDDTKALVKQVATAEADLCAKEIPQAKPGNTAADDCCWNAGLLGVVVAIYGDDPRAATWDEWGKRWALNTEAREPDRISKRIVDGKPLGEWLVTTQVFPDLTLENHGFWDLPYQVSFAALAEPIVAYAMCGKDVPESYYLNAREEGEEILKWLVMPDGDLLGPQGLDWAERDVQHQWAFTELGTLLDIPWARAAEARCLRLLLQRQAAFGDGSLHALDFGYQTDSANCWANSFLLHKYFGKNEPLADLTFDEPKGAKLFPYVNTGVFRTPDMVSSISWYGPRQAMMIVPNKLAALGDHPSFTAYRGNIVENQLSGLGFLTLAREGKPRRLRVDGEASVAQEHGALTVNFSRYIPKMARQHVGYCALPTGEVVVSSKWEALEDINVRQLADHTFYWTDIPGWLPTRTAKQQSDGSWNIGDKLRLQVVGDSTGEVVEAGLVAAAKNDFAAKKGDVLQDTVCVYQSIVPNRSPINISGGGDELQIGDWKLRRDAEGKLELEAVK